MAEYNYIGIGAGTGYAELGLKVSEQVLPMLFANVAYLKGYMVDGRYDAEGQNFASIVIPTLRRPQGHFHSMKDVAFNPYAPSSDRTFQDHITLDVDKQYDELVDLPEAMVLQNVIGGKLESIMADRIGRVISEEINLITCGAMVDQANAYSSEKALNARKIEYLDITNATPASRTNVPNAFARLKAKIGNADPSKGDTSFNGIPMSAVICNSLEAELLSTQNQFILESSYGQEILVEGTFGRITLADNVAYRGRIQGVNVFALPDGFFPSKEDGEAVRPAFEHDPSTGKVLGVMAVAEATYRVFVDKGIKISDATLYRGWILQPLYRLGVKVAKPWGIGLLVSNDYVDTNLQAPEAFSAVEFEAGTSNVGDTKVKTLTATGANGYLYKKGDQKVTYKGSYANGTDSWATATAGSTVIASCTAGDKITVIAVDASGKAIAKAVHTLVATEIKAS